MRIEILDSIDTRLRDRWVFYVRTDDRPCVRLESYFRESRKPRGRKWDAVAVYHHRESDARGIPRQLMTMRPLVHQRMRDLVIADLLNRLRWE